MTSTGPPATSAADRWREQLAAWAVPEEILAAAPEPPWGFPVELFRADASGEPRTSAADPSRARAAEELPAGGSVLDVGCGGGSATFALVPPAVSVAGVDSSADMLTEYAAAAAVRGVQHREVLGTWPEVAAAAPTADVVVCHHVLYNVPDLEAFAAALTAHAARRVVVELSARHPLVETAALWRHFHRLERPEGPTADLAAEVVAAGVLEPAGLALHREDWTRPPRAVPREVFVRLNRRRLCLPESAEPEVDRMMGDTPWPRQVTTLWWDVHPA